MKKTAFLIAFLVPATAFCQDLALNIAHWSRTTGADGVLHTVEFSERFVRSGNQVWRERVLPAASHARHGAHAHASSADSHAHKHLNLAAGARWIVRADGDHARLQVVDRDERVVVDVDRTEWPSVGFDGSWTSTWQLVDADALRAMQRAGATDDGGRWYESRRDDTLVRVLWDERLKYPRLVESRARDGTLVRRTRATRAAMPSTLPWRDAAQYARKNISDYMD